MDSDIIEALRELVGEAFVLTNRDKIQDYLQDETPETVRPHPASDVVLVKPASAGEVSGIMKLADENKLAVFLRGGGTGLVGGAIPSKNGIVISLERMDRIEIDNDNLMAIVEAGATLEKLIEAATTAGLNFPLHPGDESAQIGGLIVTNAGGANAIRYGIMRNYVKGIETVLPSGEVVKLGGKLQKNNSGYDLMQLIIGSEGTLAVVTKGILKLYPKSDVTAIMIIPFENGHDAIGAVPKILCNGKAPLAIEYVEKDLMEKTAKALGENWPDKQGYCYLLVTVAETNSEQVILESSRIGEVCQANKCLEILFAEASDEKNRILKIRSAIYSVLKDDSADILDVTVPSANIGKMIDAVNTVAEKYSVALPTYGHAGDGNLHVHIMKNDKKNAVSIDELRNEIYHAAINLEGVITGEHGIGRTRIGSVSRYIPENELELMRKIKRVFDPNNTLNPGVKIPL